MKSLTLKTSLIGGVLIFAGICGNAQAIDSERYIKLANATIQEANGGFIPNINQLIKTQQTMVEIGVAGSKEYIRANPQHADILNEVIANAENMMNMSLEEIEDKWHMGKHMRSKGFDLDKFDHFSPLFSLMDSIIHPATSYISLKEYKRTRDTQYLGRASAELIEVVEHVSHINDDKGPVLTQH